MSLNLFARLPDELLLDIISFLCSCQSRNLHALKALSLTDRRLRFCTQSILFRVAHVDPYHGEDLVVQYRNPAQAFLRFFSPGHRILSYIHELTIWPWYVASL